MNTEFTPKQPRFTADETVLLGREIYKRDIRHKVEPDHIGEFIAIDVESGTWTLGVSIDDARDNLDLVRPEAVDVLLERIGYRAAISLGGGAPRRETRLEVEEGGCVVIEPMGKR